MNNIIEYTEILNNCGARVKFDPRTLISQLEYYKNWKNIILKRHHEFVLAYLEGKYNLKKVKNLTGYSINDLESIFLRIQSQFEMYEDNNDIIFKDMYVSIDHKSVLSGNRKEINPEEVYNEMKNEIKSEIKQDDNILNDEKVENENIIEIKELSDEDQIIRNIIKSYHNLETGRKLSRENRVYELGFLLSQIEDISKFKKHFPDKIYKSVILLIKGKKLPYLAKQLRSTQTYLTQIILGKKNPRCLSEKGVILLLEEYLQKQYKELLI